MPIHLRNRPRGDNLVPSNTWPNMDPQVPVKYSKKQNPDPNDRKDEIWIAIWIRGSIRWDERGNGQEDVRKEVEDRDWEEGVPG